MSVNFLDQYKLEKLDESDLITFEYEIQDSFIKYSEYCYDLAIKKHKGYLYKVNVAFLSSYITFTMIKWLGTTQSRKLSNDVIEFISSEAKRVRELCKKFAPHHQDVGHSQRVEEFRSKEKPYSTFVQTVRVLRSIADNSMDACKNLSIYNLGKATNKEHNEFSFLDTLDFAKKETKRLRKEVSDHTYSIEEDVEGYLVKQYARQIAWIAAFFADLDKEEIDNNVQLISGVLNSLDFNSDLNKLY